MFIKKLFVSLTILLSGLLVVPTFAAQQYQVEKYYPNTPSKIGFQKLFITEKNGNIVVKGSLKKRSRTSYRSAGHIDIAVYDSNGELVEETTTRYVPSLNHRKAQRKRGSRFSATLANTPPAGSTIKVAFHSDGYRPLSKPVHENSIFNHN